MYRFKTRENSGNTPASKPNSAYEESLYGLYCGCSSNGLPNGDHVFLYRNAPLKKDIIRAQLKSAGERVGVKVYPHRLRHTCATQLLNAGCRITSIQQFLGHKDLASTMIYARAHDQTVACDYFAAMQRVEERLQIVPTPQKDIEVVNVQEPEKLTQLIERLELPELCFEERLGIAGQLREMLSMVDEHPPPMETQPSSSETSVEQVLMFNSHLPNSLQTCWYS